MENSNNRIDLTDRIAIKLETMAVSMKEFAFSLEKYNELFPNGKINTPVGEVKMGEN